MKRSVIILSLLAIFSSCVFDSPESRPVDAARLKNYALEKFVKYVDVPTEALELALDFDNYLKMSEEEKEKSLFYGNIRKTEENVFQISIDYSVFTDAYKVLSCVLDTKGVSIQEEGAVWTIKNYNTYGNDLQYSYLDYSFELDEGSDIMKLSDADSTWAVSIDEKNVVKLKMRPMRDELHEWEIKSQGTETTDIGFTSEFSTSEGFLIRERVLDSGVRSFIHSGRFVTNIFRDSEPYDYCHIIFEPGLMMETVTSRD